MGIPRKSSLLRHRFSCAAVYHPAMWDVTQLINAIAVGGPKAADQLLPLVYEELRKLVAGKMA